MRLDGLEAIAPQYRQARIFWEPRIGVREGATIEDRTTVGLDAAHMLAGGAQADRGLADQSFLRDLWGYAKAITGLKAGAPIEKQKQIPRPKRPRDDKRERFAWPARRRRYHVDYRDRMMPC